MRNGRNLNLTVENYSSRAPQRYSARGTRQQQASGRLNVESYSARAPLQTVLKKLQLDGGEREKLLKVYATYFEMKRVNGGTLQTPMNPWVEIRNVLTGYFQSFFA